VERNAPSFLVGKDLVSIDFYTSAESSKYEYIFTVTEDVSHYTSLRRKLKASWTMLSAIWTGRARGLGQHGTKGVVSKVYRLEENHVGAIHFDRADLAAWLVSCIDKAALIRVFEENE
jgi:hypothetical protein